MSGALRQLLQGATAAVLVAGNGPMTALGITDPRTWNANSWATDVVPHLAHGVVTAHVLMLGD